MITIFSTLKPFEGHIGIIQRNAVKSWTKLKGEPEIILLGDEPGVANICEELNIKHIPNIELNEYGRPYCQDVFKKAQGISKFKINAYVNGDIILTDSFVDGSILSSEFEHFLMIGQRYDLEISQLIDFENDNWEDILRLDVKKKGILHKNSGIDYLVFKRLDWMNIPPMVIGKIAWDNWMVSKALNRSHEVIDATNAILIVHQNHINIRIKDYKLLLSQDPESAKNRKLADTLGGSVHQGFVKHANWKILKIGEMLRCQ